MEHSDKGFEEFRDLLRPFRESHPLLWRIRDNLYAALYYRVPGGGRERRHRAGLWSWSLWAVGKALLAAKKSVPAVESSSRFHFLFCGPHSAHFDTLVPLVREAAARFCKVTLRDLDWRLRRKQTNKFLNVARRDLPFCISAGAIAWLRWMMEKPPLGTR